MSNVKKSSIAIVGGGPAGLSAAVYAVRANAEVTLFERFGAGGCMANIDNIENFPSRQNVDGFTLAEDMRRQAVALGAAILRERVVSVTKSGDSFVITTDKNSYNFASVIAATGCSHGKLGFEQPYIGRGVSYCATCDGNFYRGKSVAVTGSGNAAVKEALYLSGVCAQVVFLATGVLPDSSDSKRLASLPNMEIIENCSVTALHGEETLDGVTYLHGGKSCKVAVSALFVAVGSKPETAPFDALSPKKNAAGFLVTGSDMQTSIPGLFAAGDVTDGPLKQIVTACADGAKAGNFAAAYARKHG